MAKLGELAVEIEIDTTGTVRFSGHKPKLKTAVWARIRFFFWRFLQRRKLRKLKEKRNMVLSIARFIK